MTARLGGEGAGEYRFVAAADGLAGWVRKDLPENFFAEFSRDPGGFLSRSSPLVLKDGPKTRVVRHGLQEARGVRFNVVTKQFRYTGLRRFGFVFFPSPALRSLRGALLLQAKGIPVARPLAALEYRTWKKLGTSYYISEEILDSRPLNSFWYSVLRKLPAHRRTWVTRSIAGDLARLMARLHSMGLYHRDLKESNILIQGGEDARRRFFLVDLDWVVERSRVPLSRRLKNLWQVRRRAWSPREKIYFYIRYARSCGGSKQEAAALARKIIARSRKKDSPSSARQESVHPPGR